MAKKVKQRLNKNIVLAVFAVAFVAVVGLVFLNPNLTGNAVSCMPGNIFYSMHVDGNKDGYVAAVNKARITVSSTTSNCKYEGITDENGNLNLRVNPGKYKVSVIKTGKCNAHSEYITITSSGVTTFRLKNCSRMFNV